MITEDYLKAFYMLSNGRVKNGVLNITDICSYFNTTNLFDDFEMFVKIIQEADISFLNGLPK